MLHDRNLMRTMLPFTDAHSDGKNLMVVETKNPIHPLLWKTMLLCGVMMYGSYSILVHLCELNGQIPFNSASVVLMIEVTKLLVSTALSYKPLQQAKVLHQLKLRSCLPFCVPAILYCINNNVAVHMQVHMDPATFQVLCNLKIISTAILYKLVIQRPITGVQWFSLLLLTVAGISNSYGGLENKLKTSTIQGIFLTWTGLLLMMLYCLISGLAGVCSEYILKRQRQLSLSIQNMVLYMYGVVCNGFAYLIVANGRDVALSNFFSGYSSITWLIIITQAASGLIMSAIMKHSSNITRLFYISCAMLVTTTLSVSLLALQLNSYFIVASFLVIFALVLYHKK